MKFRIHFTRTGTEDFFDIEGESIEEIKESSKKEISRRFLTEEKNNLWSEEL